LSASKQRHICDKKKFQILVILQPFNTNLF
jgi:hypothetical protein